MAIVKASYTDSPSKIKKTVKYIQHRTGRDGEKITRTLFGVDGEISRDEVYQLIDEAPPGTRFFHLKISPDPKREDGQRDLNLREITDETLFALSQKLHYHVEYAGAVHDDHTKIRHVHVVAMVWGELHRDDLKVLRDSATAAALAQRRERDVRRSITLPRRQKTFVPRGSRRKLRGLSPGTRSKRPDRCSICGRERCKEHSLELELQLEREV